MLPDVRRFSPSKRFFARRCLRQTRTRLPAIASTALNSKLNLHDCITILEEFAFKVVSCQIRKIFYLKHSFTTLKLGSISWKNENRGLNKAENKNRIDFPKLSPISLLKFKSEIRQLINENNSFNVFNAIRF